MLRFTNLNFIPQLSRLATILYYKNILKIKQNEILKSVRFQNKKSKNPVVACNHGIFNLLIQYLLF
jgi:hypothetical protein